MLKVRNSNGFYNTFYEFFIQQTTDESFLIINVLNVTFPPLNCHFLYALLLKKKSFVVLQVMSLSLKANASVMYFVNGHLLEQVLCVSYYSTKTPGKE